MCGIAGIAAFNDAPGVDVRVLESMCNTIVHRGPDEAGMDIRDGVAVGMRRLSIIDLSPGTQPIFNEDRTVRAVFNGEIYNFRQLRQELKARGHRFRTHTDSEVIVHAYEEYGPNFPTHLNGMFAFALHDSFKKKLILARDHIGIKPLYYAFTPTHVVWGSEIKAVLASRMIDRRLDVDALAEFLAWEYIPGKKTLFEGIHKLEPGNLLEIDLYRPACSPRAFWDVPIGNGFAAKSFKEWQDEIDGTLQRCVQRQMISDVPLGAFLSGGVDSSLVVASMGNAGTFSIGFDDPSYNELKWARKVARHLGLDHVNDLIKPDVAGLFDTLMQHMDDPIGDFSIFPTYLVSRHARNYVTVALSGDGGDELFGGYETYLADGIARRYNLMPGFIRKHLIERTVKLLKPRPEKKGLINKALRFVEGLEQPDELSHARWRIFAGEAIRHVLFTPEALAKIETPAGHHILDLFKRAGNRDPLNKSLYVDVKSYLVDNCLVKTDRMSMAVSLEARVPFLDTEMVALAFNIPGRLKVAGGESKKLLKRVAAAHVPKECVYRPKEGFSIPMKNWLGTRFLPLMNNLLDKNDLKSQGLFEPAAVEQLKKEHLAGIANHSHILWSLMVFQDWRRRWLEAPI
ncbi:MAG: asparagine synthase (glutamine-hydrolyzing) [Desulfobacterales bacterium]